MWTPGVVFENQVSLEGVTDAIKGKSDAIVEIFVVDCFDKTKCEKTKQIRFKYTISLGVNCPDMHFNAFPFDSQHCDILLQDLDLDGSVTVIVPLLQVDSQALGTEVVKVGDIPVGGDR